MKLLSLLVALTVSMTTSISFADQAPATEAQEQTSSAQGMSLTDYLSTFTVKVSNLTSPIFNPKLGGGSGTGYIVTKVRNEKGVEVYHLFTNRHVIESSQGSSSMQNISVAFHSAPGAEFKAQLVYKSDLHDFAVLEVNAKEVESLKIPITPAPLPISAHDPKTAEGKLLNDFEKMIRHARSNVPALKGMDSIAVGNPLGMSDVVTKGSINAFMSDPSIGPFIQTQTPINPGNSGGPLLVTTGANTLVVVGMNTLLFSGAQNMGFAIPIGVVMQEYMNWVNQHTLARPKDYVLLNMHSPDLIENLGYSAQIKKAFPNYEGGPVLGVAQITKNSPLQANDLIITAGGTRVGTLYGYKRLIASINYKKQKTLPLEVLREGQLVKIDLPLAPLGFSEARTELDFAYVSGFVFQQLSPKLAATLRPDIKSRVFVANVVRNPEMDYAPGLSVIPPMSLLQSIEIDGKHTQIEKLFDLKMALRTVKPNSVVVAHYFKYTAGQQKEDGTAVAPSYAPTLSHTRITKPEIYTPSDLSLRDIKENAELDVNGDPDSRNWRTYIKPKAVAPAIQACDDILAAKKAI